MQDIRSIWDSNIGALALPSKPHQHLCNGSFALVEIHAVATSGLVLDHLEVVGAEPKRLENAVTQLHPG